MTYVLIEGCQGGVHILSVDVHDLDVVTTWNDDTGAHIRGEEDLWACWAEVGTACTDWLLSGFAFTLVLVGFGSGVRGHYQRRLGVVGFGLVGHAVTIQERDWCWLRPEARRASA